MVKYIGSRPSGTYVSSTGVWDLNTQLRRDASSSWPDQSSAGTTNYFAVAGDATSMFATGLFTATNCTLTAASDTSPTGGLPLRMKFVDKKTDPVATFSYNTIPTYVGMTLYISVFVKSSVNGMGSCKLASMETDGTTVLKTVTTTFTPTTLWQRVSLSHTVTESSTTNISFRFEGPVSPADRQEVLWNGICIQRPTYSKFTKDFRWYTSALTSVDSYAGTGTKYWMDQSGNDNHWLHSNVTVSGNAIVYNGTDSYTTSNYTGGKGATIYPARTNFTYDMWIKPASGTITLSAESTTGTAGVAGQKYLVFPDQGTGVFAGAGISVGTNGVSVYEHAGGYLPSLLTYTGTISTTSPTHLVVVYTGNQPRLYLNGTLVKTGLTSTKTALQKGFTVGGGAYGYYTGTVYAVNMIPWSLSATEVLAAYTASVASYS